jgi:hypothetical protein
MYLARYIFFLDALLGSNRTTPFQKRSLSSVPNTAKLSETEGSLLTDETVRFTGIQTRPYSLLQCWEGSRRGPWPSSGFAILHGFATVITPDSSKFE